MIFASDSYAGYFVKNVHGDLTSVWKSKQRISNTPQTKLASYDYTGYGETLTETGTFDNPIRYSGEYLNSILNVCYQTQDLRQ